MKPLLRIGLPIVLLLALGWWISRPRVPGAPPSHDPFGAVSDTASWDSVTSELEIAGDPEPGTPLVVFGQVFGADGRAVHGARILVYHADARGEYGTSPRNRSWARLSGRLQTDSLGRYRIRTVRPGSYGGPAHVHFVISRPWGTEQGFELRFADEPQGTPVLPGLAADTGRFATIRGVVRDAGGVVRVRRDFRLQ